MATKTTRSAARPAAPRTAPPPAPAARRAGGIKAIKVRAKEMGYYAHILRRPGDVFTLAAGDPLGKWMEPVDGRTPEKVTSHGEALKQHQAATADAAANGGLNRDDVDDAEVADNPLGDD